MSCDVLVMSEGEARVKLYRHSVTKTVEIKTSSSGAGNIMPASSVRN